MTRALAPVAVLALISALAGYSDDDSGSDGNTDVEDKPVVALAADQISQAVLQPDNMGEGGRRPLRPRTRAAHPAAWPTSRASPTG